MEFDDKIREFSAKRAGPAFRSPHDVIASLANEGEPIPLGWAPLDRQLRGGGARAGRLIVLGGPPQSGKTTVICQAVLHLSQIYPVYTLFADEGDEGAATRIGVQLGVALEKIESDRPAASSEMADKEAERSIFMVEPDRPDSIPEQIVNAIVARHKTVEAGARAVLVLDSIQTISKFFLAKKDGDRRLSIEKFMEITRQWAIDHRLLILLTSRSNRASYRSKRDADNSEDISSFAESAAIEFGADVAVVFGLPDKETRIGKVAIVKNRLAGSLNPFSHRYDETTGRMLEIDKSSIDIAAENKAHDNILKARKAIVETLTLAPTGLYANQLQELAVINTRRTTFLAARQSLINDHTIFYETEGKHMRYKLSVYPH